jgi:SAM-dependent methyltransferase
LGRPDTRIERVGFGMATLSDELRRTLAEVADFYDRRKVGDVGPLGFRRSTNLGALLDCTDRLIEERIVEPGKTLFLDLGCADGRVNVFLSYLVKASVGVELDEWTLDEYAPLRTELERTLMRKDLLTPPARTFLFHGDSTDERIHAVVERKTGIGIHAFDLFYTYLVMQEEFAAMIAEKAKPGAVFIVYGLNRIMPRLDGLRLLEDLSPMEGILGLYQKE